MSMAAANTEVAQDYARVRRKAKREMMNSLRRLAGSAHRPHVDPVLQRAVVSLLLTGYTPAQIATASGGRLSETDVVDSIRGLLAYELKTILPLFRGLTAHLN